MKKILIKPNTIIAAPEAATTEYNFRMEGPKANNGLSWPPRLMYAEDWSPKYDVLWLRPNTPTFNCTGKVIRLLGHEEIEEFVKAVHDSGKLAFTILTQNADYGADPNAIRIIYRDHGISIRSSTWCKPSDIDAETGILVQKILNILGAKVKFNDIFDEWDNKWKALYNDGNAHTIADMMLNYTI